MILWEPDKEAAEKSAVSKFISNVSNKYNIDFSDFHSFRHWTAAAPEIFWKELVAFSEIKFRKTPDKIISNPELMPGAKWFEGAELNYAENILRRGRSKTAIVSWNETGRQSVYSSDQLRHKVAEFQQYYLKAGVQKGDVVAGLMPNIPETIFAFLAAASIGAVWTSCSPDFSSAAVLDRFQQADPKILISIDGYLYKGKKNNILENVKSLTEQLCSLKSVLLIPQFGKDCEISGIKNSKQYSDIYLSDSAEPVFESMPSNSPLFILYSSGTTGKPKCIVHSTIGILLEHVKEHKLEADITEDDVVFYNTTCGWMMWNWLVSVLYQGACIVLYEGFAFERDGNIIFDLLQDEKVTVFGTSAAYLQKAEELKLKPKNTHKLSKLKSILSTGSRLKPESFDYVYDSIGNMHLCPIWGGTDLCGCLGLSSPLLPVYRGEIQTRGLGLDVDIADDECKSVKNTPGEVIVRKPFPSMPLYFLNDPDNKKYIEAYFTYYPEKDGRRVWWHGDLGILTENQGIIVLGRSDDTLNPGGVRIGAAEVTTTAESVPEILEAMAVAQNWNNDERIILFVILHQGVLLTDDIKKRIIDKMPSPRHRPKKILAVQEFPTTINGKRSAKTVRDIINGKEISNLSALANPAVVSFYQNLNELNQE